MPYDLELGGIELPTLHEEFSETIGAEYTLVGAVPMPGPPRPVSLYNMSIPVHGEPEEVDQTAAGMAKRLAVRSLIQNDATRYAGIELTFAHDSDINGWLVIGTAELAYAPGNVNIGEFVLRMSGVAKIPAMQTLSAHRLAISDRRIPTTPLDINRRQYRPSAVREDAVARHYLPVGAFDVIGEAGEIEAQRYPTIFGDAVLLENRPHGELVKFDHDWADVSKGVVRVWDATKNPEPEWSADGDQKSTLYGWGQVFGSDFHIVPGSVPVMDNGVSRVRLLEGTKFAIDAVDGDRYKLADSTLDLGYDMVKRSGVAEWTRERAIVRLLLTDTKGRLAEAAIILQRGWRGPRVEITHHSSTHPKMEATGDHHREEGQGWEQVQMGVERDEALIGTFGIADYAARL